MLRRNGWAWRISRLRGQAEILLWWWVATCTSQDAAGPAIKKLQYILSEDVVKGLFSAQRDLTRPGNHANSVGKCRQSNSRLSRAHVKGEESFSSSTTEPVSDYKLQLVA